MRSDRKISHNIFGLIHKESVHCQRITGQVSRWRKFPCRRKQAFVHVLRAFSYATSTEHEGRRLESCPDVPLRDLFVGWFRQKPLLSSAFVERTLALFSCAMHKLLREVPNVALKTPQRVLRARLAVKQLEGFAQRSLRDQNGCSFPSLWHVLAFLGYGGVGVNELCPVDSRVHKQ